MKKVKYQDAVEWMEENLTTEQIVALQQVGVNEVGYKDWIAALLADFANSVQE